MKDNSANMVYTPGGNIVNFIPSKAVAVTPHDTATFQKGLLYIGAGGDIKCKLADDTDFVTFKNVPDASILPFYVVAVHTDSVASEILVLY